MDERTVTAQVERVVTPLGLEVDDVDVGSVHKKMVLRIVLDGDGPQGRGPTIDEIAEATRAISKALDEGKADGDKPYTLEVSSRGVARPLTKPAHYRRNVGRLVKLTLSDGSMTAGRIIKVNDDAVVVNADGAQCDIGLQEIAKAVIQVEMSRVSAEDEE